MSYGHAHEILAATGQKSPAAELRVAVRRLKAWADRNPSLRSLYLDFEACLRDLDGFLAALPPQADGTVAPPE
jgi:hypothetical protein